MRQSRYILAMFVGLVGCTPAVAQSLSEQIDAVARAQQAEQAQRYADYQAEMQRQAQQAAQQRARVAEIERRKLAVQAAAEREARADKQRDQDYQDKLRNHTLQAQDLLLEAERAKLQQIKTRVARENEYIDRDLKRQDAKTDVIQSDADAQRALATGTGTMLHDFGAAAVESQRPKANNSFVAQ